MNKEVPRAWFFGKVAVTGVVEYGYIGHLKVFLDSQDHLAEVQHQKDQGLGQEQGCPQRLIFLESCSNRSCYGWSYLPSKGVSGRPGPSGWSPAPNTPRCRARARTSTKSEFLENIALIRVVQDQYVGHSKVFPDRQGHLNDVLCHLKAFGTIRYARKASGA